jgi:predicted dienelactone hydrolase
MKKIDFEGVPDSLYHISDLVIQNSINNNQQSQEYRLVDSLNAEELNNIQAVSPREEVRDTTPYRQLTETDSLKFSFEGEKMRAADRR